MSDVTGADGARLHIRRLTIEDAMTLAAWSPPAPWAVADNLEAPPPDEGFWLVESSAGELVGYCAFGEPARVPGLPDAHDTLDVAMGVAPAWRRRGLSVAVAETVLTHARALADGRQLRTAVPAHSEAAHRVTVAAGFAPTGEHRFGATTYRVYAQP